MTTATLLSSAAPPAGPGSLNSRILHLVQADQPHNSIRLQARLWDRALRGAGQAAEVYGHRTCPQVSAGDVLLYHYGSFAPSAWRYARRPRTIFVFHNVTPARLLVRWNPLVAARAVAATLQLSTLPAELPWIGHSPFNCQILHRYGFRRVRHVPLVVEPSPRQAKTPAPTLLFVGRICPNKNVIELLRVYREIRAAASVPPRLVIVGQRKRRCRYGDAFEAELRTMGPRADVVWERNPLPYRDLLRLHAASWLYLSLSLHEGCGVPVCQSIASHTPALYLECGGTESVLGGAGQVALRDRTTFAERVLATLESEAVRESLLARQQRHVQEWSAAAVRGALLEAVADLVGS